MYVALHAIQINPRYTLNRALTWPMILFKVFYFCFVQLINRITVDYISRSLYVHELKLPREIQFDRMRGPMSDVCRCPLI